MEYVSQAQNKYFVSDGSSRSCYGLSFIGIHTDHVLGLL